MIEFFWVLVNQLIVKFLLWLNDVASTWSSGVSNSIVSSRYSLAKHLLVFDSSVFVFDESLGRGGMFLIVWTSAIVLVHDLIEAISVSVISSLV